MITYIYALRCPLSNDIKYIGRSYYPNQRLIQHSNDKHNPEKYFWMQEVKNQGKEVILDILEECNSYNVAEREQYWLSQYPNTFNTKEKNKYKPDNYKSMKITYQNYEDLEELRELLSIQRGQVMNKIQTVNEVFIIAKKVIKGNG